MRFRSRAPRVCAATRALAAPCFPAGMDSAPALERLVADLSNVEHQKDACVAIAMLASQQTTPPRSFLVLVPPLCALLAAPSSSSALLQNGLAGLSGLCQAVQGAAADAAAHGAARTATALLLDATHTAAVRCNAAELAHVLAVSGSVEAVLSADAHLAAFRLLSEEAASLPEQLQEACADVIAACTSESGNDAPSRALLVAQGTVAKLAGLLGHANPEVKIRILLSVAMMLSTPGAVESLMSVEAALGQLEECRTGGKGDASDIAADILSQCHKEALSAAAPGK